MGFEDAGVKRNWCKVLIFQRLWCEKFPGKWLLRFSCVRDGGLECFYADLTVVSMTDFMAVL